MELYFVIGVVAAAFAFDYLNGFHDAANSIATVVSTRVLSPGQAVLWAAFFNFVAAFVFGTAVAKTMGSGLVDLNVVSSGMVLAALWGAIVWDLVTWYAGLPTSSSHALMGGYGGAAIARAGFGAILTSGWTKPLIFIVFAPLIGLVIALAISIATLWMFRTWAPSPVDRLFRKLQLLSAAAYSLGHGTADAQKTMGIVAGVLFAGGYIKTFYIPYWVILGAHAAMGLGTLTGGWRIVRTMGQKITKLQPVGGFAAETAGAITLMMLSMRGIPVSTTHTITGAIVGVGATRRLSAVRWGVAGRIVWAWVLTIPASAAVAALSYWTLGLFGIR
jgi:PiT family inorganic phosphate transporter